MEEDSKESSEIKLGNAGIAFLLVIAAGMCTAVGAAAVYFERLVQLASKPVLAAGLGFAAGVMLDASFMDIFVKSSEAFEAHGQESAHAYLLATVCLFLGMAVMYLLAYIAHILDPDENHHENQFADLQFGCSVSKDCGVRADSYQTQSMQCLTSQEMRSGSRADSSNAQEDRTDCNASQDAVSCVPACGLSSMTMLSASMFASHHGSQSQDIHQTGSFQPHGRVIGAVAKVPASYMKNSSDARDTSFVALSIEPEKEQTRSDRPCTGTGEVGGVAPLHQAADTKLKQMGLKTAAAIAMHNAPEGLATFVAYIADPTVGVTLAIAIAFHNIPEGLCIALPIYYSTGSRRRGFLLALFSGVTEPIGAFIGWLIILATGQDVNQLVYGILFGVVAGMMIMISFLELLPTAHRYDPQDRFVTKSLVCGMIAMSTSLVLLQF